ncbi:prostaglandin D2 receptor isoform X1 [Falco biarmicus]|uniref:prostaglandin D2 receptor isoform X1 n=1 Tax=Falco biarmicus TaxID=345155 RepID=UPI0024BC1716|nr:prostaglandin D2 receptor isoform X1 [Falco biarmicus]
METEGYRCRSSRYIEGGQSAVPSSVLFAAGLLGNVLALLLLGQHRRRSRSPGGRPPRVSAFYVLVSGLAVTDLLGKCLLSPIVLAAYAYNRSLSELGPGGRSEGEPGVLCQLFAFLMAFFGLAPTLLLLAMALECWLSLGHPYFYRRHFTRRLGATLGPVAAGLCALFCALPLLGFGVPMQYCPGTWCFIRMAGGGPRHLSFPVLYASLMGLLVLAIGACNVSSMRHLYSMARRQPHRGPAATAAPHMEELDHLILLGLMTVLFTICSLPLIGLPEAKFPESHPEGTCPGGGRPVLSPGLAQDRHPTAWLPLNLWVLQKLAPAGEDEEQAFGPVPLPRSILRQHGAGAGRAGVRLAVRGRREVFLHPPQAAFHPREEPCGGSWIPVNISEQQHFVEGLGSTRLQESRRVLACGFRAVGTHRAERGCVCVSIK